MLFLNSTIVFGIFINYFCILFIFILFFKNQQFIFTKIWCVLCFFIIQCLLLGFFGEDFFIILIVVSELPIFFCFFFFFISKTQLKGLSSKTNNISKLYYITPVVVYLTWFFNTSSNCFIGFTYFLPDTLLFVPQRSDFFVYFFNFFITTPQITFFIGLLITAVTFVILLFTFKNQINSLLKITNIRHVNWVRTQDPVTQNNHPRVFTFFKV